LIPPVPFREFLELRREAEAFLAQTHPSSTLPIPIEEIVEIEMGLEISIIERLSERYGILGSITTNFKTFVVDAGIYRQTNRYRLTLAHEVGHLLLHPEQVRAVACPTPELWKAAIQSIPSKDYSRMEAQAHIFAGCLLVPKQPLLDSYEEAARLAESRGMDLSELGDAGFEDVCGWIGKRFGVSWQVVYKQLEHEGILTG